jgi:hypothetical protein
MDQEDIIPWMVDRSVQHENTAMTRVGFKHAIAVF